MMPIVNRRAHHDYQILEKFEAGFHLTGPEVKSVKNGRLDLTGSFGKIVGSEVYLLNSKIYPYEFSNKRDYDLKRTRKLLLHKKEILRLKTKIANSNLTIIPLSCYNKRGLLKLEIALARGKKKYEKKEALKRRDLEREIKNIV